jgi:hypothetical protein
MTSFLKKLSHKYGVAAMHADNKDTGHNRTIHITGIEDAPLQELSITVMYVKDNEGQTVQKAVTLDKVVIPAILAGLNKGGVHAEVEEEADGKEKWIQKSKEGMKEGALHKQLGVPKGEKIPEGKLKEAAKSDNEKLRKRAQWALNVGKK